MTPFQRLNSKQLLLVLIGYKKAVAVYSKEDIVVEMASGNFNIPGLCSNSYQHDFYMCM